jgi:hypothetical protein
LYRFPVVLFLSACVACAEPVYLDDSFPVSVRPTLQSLADDVWDLIGTMFHNNPPLDLPIHVHYEKSDAPMTSVKDDMISIRLTSGGAFYAQFAFQLGHELGHVMLDPRRANGLVETICTAVSYEVLDRLVDRVTVSPRLSWITDYAPHFHQYRVQDQKSYMEQFPEDVRAMVAEERWTELGTYLAEHRSDMESKAAKERATQTLAAVVLRSSPIDWGQFTGFAACTTPSPSERPRFRIAPINQDCIDRLANVLCRIGWGCGN